MKFLVRLNICALIYLSYNIPAHIRNGVGIFGLKRRLLVKIQRVVYEERNVVFHAHVDNAFICVQLDGARVRILRAVHGVVKTQSPLFLLGIAEGELKKSISIFPIGAWRSTVRSRSLPRVIVPAV